MPNRKCKKLKLTKEVNASPTEAYFPIDNPVPTSSQVAKTHIRWSEKMEEVMLNALYEEVVQNGRRDDNGLKTESMRAAADVVNFTLKMQVTSEHVRTRLKTLKKDYFNVRELLDRSCLGFTFDTENKIVVAAEEDAWERYFQAHPDLRHLRDKHFPYFEQLSLIIGNGKFQNLKKNKKINASRTKAYSPIDKPVPTSSQVAKTQIRWSKKMEEVMVNTLYEEVIRNGKRADNGLKAKALRAAANVVNFSLKMQVTSEHVRSRLKTLKKEYRIVRELLDHSCFGFTFDTENKIIVAAKEDAWERYFQAHPDSRHLRDKHFPYFEQLSLIMGNEKFKDPRKTKKVIASPTETYFPTDNPVTSSQFAKTQLRWSKKMDEVMVNALYEEVIRNGKRLFDNGLKMESMRATADTVNFTLKMQVTSEHVRTRLKTLKKGYRIVREFLDLSGFGFTFDTENKIVVAAKEDAWERYFQAHPNSRHLRGKRFPYFEQLNIIVGYDGIANGKYQATVDEELVEGSPDCSVVGGEIDTDSDTELADGTGLSSYETTVAANASISNDAPGMPKTSPLVDSLDSKRKKSRLEPQDFMGNEIANGEYQTTVVDELVEGSPDCSVVGDEIDTDSDTELADGTGPSSYETTVAANASISNDAPGMPKTSPLVDPLNSKRKKSRLEPQDFIMGNEIANGEYQTVVEELAEGSRDCSVIGDEMDTGSDTELADGTGLSFTEPTVAANASFSNDAADMHKTSPLDVPLTSKRKKSRLEPQDFMGCKYAQGIMDAIQSLVEAIVGPKIDDITAALKPICNGDKHLYLKGLDYLGVDNKQAKIFLGMDSDLRLGWLVDKLQYVKPFNPNECSDT